MKENINVLVIDSNETMTKEMEKYFSSHEVIKVVACKNDGEEGLSYILNHHHEFDLIVMDLILPRLDGLFLLSELQKRNIHKNIIVTTSYKDDYIMDEANQYGINYYMLKPINFLNLEKRILNIRNYTINEAKMNNQEVIISDLLHKLGIPSHIRGYQYIKEGINIVYSSGNRLSYITKDVYPEIAKKFDTTSSRVERAIRHAIEISWNRGDLNIMEELFGNSLNVNRDKPTNSEYLSTIADRLRLKKNIVYN